MRIKTIYLFLLFPLFYSCISPYDNGIPVQTEGYVPVYSNDISTLKKIAVVPARASVRGGKMYTVGNLLFQVEQDSGIHVLNYANPSNPQILGFIKSLLCREISVQNGFIYTNNLSDLVVIDAGNWANVHEAGRVAGVFPDLVNPFPEKPGPNVKVYFECPDSKKGAVVGWTKQIISNPKCWR